MADLKAIHHPTIGASLPFVVATSDDMTLHYDDYGDLMFVDNAGRETPAPDQVAKLLNIPFSVLAHPGETEDESVIYSFEAGENS
jgi:hypothetical protein